MPTDIYGTTAPPSKKRGGTEWRMAHFCCLKHVFCDKIWMNNMRTCIGAACMYFLCVNWPVWPQGVPDAEIIAISHTVQTVQMMPQGACDGHRGHHCPFVHATWGAHILRLVPVRVHLFLGFCSEHSTNIHIMGKAFFSQLGNMY